jgi:type VI secretion system protein ImpC
MPSRVEFDMRFGRDRRRRDDDEPMRLLVLGDFSGKPADERPPLASRPMLRVDPDNFDQVLRRLRPQVTVPAGPIQFEQLDDFHPDRLYARLELFQSLRQARTTLPSGPDPLLGRLLGKPAEAAAPVAPATGLDALIRNVVAPHIVKDTSAETRSYVVAVDSAIEEQMRALLHHPDFQAREAAWRGVRWVMSNLELDENLQLHLFDVTREELLADFVASRGQVAQTAAHDALIDRWRNVPGSQGWSAFAALTDFDPSDASLGLLAALGLIAREAGAPLLAGAEWALATGEGRGVANWQSLRRSEVAPSIALGAPRILLRLPYGKATDPIDAFAFEEFVGTDPVHDEFLWGHASLGLALLIGRAFTARGWEMDPGDEREIGGLPVYTFRKDGVQEMQACGEHFLTEKQINALLQAGLVPFASYRDRDVVVAVRFQSIADPPAALQW